MFLKNKYISFIALSCLSLSLYAASSTFNITNHTDCVCTPIDPSNLSSAFKCHTQDQDHPGETIYVGELQHNIFKGTVSIALGNKPATPFTSAASDIVLSKSNSTSSQGVETYHKKPYTDMGVSDLTMVTLGTGENPQVFLAPTKWVTYKPTACSLKTSTHLRLSQSF